VIYGVRNQATYYTTCRQLGNDTTYDTEKKNPTSHDVAVTSAVSGRRVGKTRRHVFKTNSGRLLKKRHFQLRGELAEILDDVSVGRFHYAIVEAVEPFKLHPTFMSYIYKGVWQHTHNVTTTEVSPDLGEFTDILDDVSVEMIPLRYR
jgi:hypothetical protein